MHRFFINSIHENTVQIQGGVAQQIKNVLRMKPGDQIITLDNAGHEYLVELTSVESRDVIGIVLEKRLSAQELSVAVTLYQGMLKRDNFEWILQKGTELGIHQFVPILTQRVVAKPEFGKKQERWERILTEAAEQSHRSHIPLLSETLTFTQAVMQAAQHDLALIPWEETDPAHHLRAVLDRPAPPTRVAVFIGPEGGFDPVEVEQAQAHGIIPVSLGKLILRAETAAIHVASVFNHLYG
ncbi:MAG: 16S rRNA (uracil(1498)-N(3))-methyltransferase [Anaerolineae bacterium]